MSTAQIRELVMGLPLQDRALLARELIESLEPADAHVALEDEWLDEIESRAEAFDRGEAPADDWRTSLARVRKELRHGRQS
jgi:putative addiction module component (TIGR02574 family)